MSPHDLVGNASYVLLAASYLVTNIYWLRLLAIVALTVGRSTSTWPATSSSGSASSGPASST